MNKIQTVEKKERKIVNVFFNEDGISIIELLELDFSDFVSNFIKENVK
ncbi:hypothetical protein [uncultured Clostridium sp.]|nr:hypothetical protein [uncultured Clostridium sp.]MCI8310295.1 hypothetical protein [Clostridia bacterium]